MNKIGYTSVKTLWHYSHAISFWLFLQMEVLRLRRSGRNIPAYIDKIIWHCPSEAEDWVNLLCFLDTSECILLVDIGANVGEFSNAFRRLFQRSHIIAFEPTIEAFAALKSSFEDNENLLAENVGISDTAGEMEMYVPKDNRLSSFVAYTDITNEYRQMDVANTQTVAIRTLDSYESTIRKMNNTDAAAKVMIKIDVQVHEINVLRGGSCFENGGHCFVLMHIRPCL
ncbi:MAG: hypothetical protein C4B57_00905 [Deltaproteobacteria bacterium]|nr:MAG: hypothetical protein C4B57_00905 [Deltaproteobacteria bacterium]RLB92228.1 MAG: hypothetical protein DRH50_10070 [Deltaproteobacteria bacterium]